MGSRADLCLVVCANGLGHFRRVLEVVSCLADLERGLRMSVICENWQRERFWESELLRRIVSRADVRWVHDVMAPSVHYSQDPSCYADGRLSSWLPRVASIDDLREARLVVSDNLAGVLEARPDVVLMGSFLWSDVLEDAFSQDAQVVAFAAWERRLLAAHQPSMLCVGDIAMPGVYERTRAVPLSWMRRGERHTPRVDRPPRTRPLATVLVGASRTADRVGLDVAAALVERGFDIALPEALRAHFAQRVGSLPFGFHGEDFLACDVAVCRPGLGALHDCLFHCLPMVAMLEDNIEMVHNGRRVEALGFGVCSEIDESPRRVAERALMLATSDQAETVRTRMRETPMRGAEQAALWLRERLAQLS